MASAEARTEAVINKRLVGWLFTVIGALIAALGWFAIDKVGGIASRIDGLATDFKTLVETTIPALSRDFTQQLNDLQVTITNIQGELRSQAGDISDIDTMLGDHETRLRSVEQWRTNVINRSGSPL